MAPQDRLPPYDEIEPRRITRHDSDAPLIPPSYHAPPTRPTPWLLCLTIGLGLSSLPIFIVFNVVFIGVAVVNPDLICSRAPNLVTGLRAETAILAFYLAAVVVFIPVAVCREARRFVVPHVMLFLALGGSMALASSVLWGERFEFAKCGTVELQG